MSDEYAKDTDDRRFHRFVGLSSFYIVQLNEVLLRSIAHLLLNVGYRNTELYCSGAGERDVTAVDSNTAVE